MSSPSCHSLPHFFLVSSLSSPDCAGCGDEIKQGQSLLALEKQWHVSCFRCRTCNMVLTGEYISKWVCIKTNAEDKHKTFESVILVFPFGKDTNIPASCIISNFSDTSCFHCLRCRDGVPYCEADYHAQYGVKCETCSRYISGRVLEVRTEPDLSVRCCKQTFCCAEFHNRTKWVLTTAA